jgi:hypothetical protein
MGVILVLIRSTISTQAAQQVTAADPLLDDSFVAGLAHVTCL